jgi:hypothetical protein
MIVHIVLMALTISLYAFAVNGYSRFFVIMGMRIDLYLISFTLAMIFLYFGLFLKGNREREMERRAGAYHRRTKELSDDKEKYMDLD